MFMEIFVMATNHIVAYKFGNSKLAVLSSLTTIDSNSTDCDKGGMPATTKIQKGKRQPCRLSKQHSLKGKILKQLNDRAEPKIFSVTGTEIRLRYSVDGECRFV
jgi:hypothetical protein